MTYKTGGKKMRCGRSLEFWPAAVGAALLAFSLTLFLSAPEAFGQADIYIQNERNIAMDKSGTLSDYRAAALTAFYAGSLEVAVDFGKKSLKKAADDTAAVLIVGQSLLWSGKAADADRYYRKYFSLGGEKTAPITFQFAECLKAQNKIDEAAGYLYQAKKMAATSEAELIAQIDLSLGYCFLETGDFKKARAYFYKASSTALKPQYLEAMGDYYVKLASLDTPEIFFNVSANALEKKYTQVNYQKAYDYYKRSFNSKPDNLFIKIKIADAQWALGKKERAAGSMKKALDETNNSYACSRLAYFLKEENKTDEAVLKKCAGLLDRAVSLGGPAAELEYEKSDLYFLLNDGAAYSVSIKKAASLSRGDEWFAFYLADKLIAISDTLETADYKSVMDLCRKMSESVKNSSAADLAYAAAAVKFNRDCAIRHIKDFLDGGMNIFTGRDFYLYALKTFEGLEYEIKLKNADLEKFLMQCSSEYSLKDAREKLCFINAYIEKETDEASLLKLYESKIDLCLATGDNGAAFETALKSARLNKKDPVKYAAALKKAYTFAQYSQKNDRALEIAKELMRLGAAEKEHLISIIYSDYWGPEKKTAEEGLKRLMEIDKSSPVVLTFDGLSLAEKNRNKSALKKFREASENGGDREYLSARIGEMIKKLKPVASLGYSFISDSSRQKTAEKSLSFDIDGDGSRLMFGFVFNEENKERMLLSQRYMGAKINDFFAGTAYKVNDSAFCDLRLHCSSIDGAMAQSGPKLFPNLIFTKNYAGGSITANYFEKYLRDTPLAYELALSQKALKINFNVFKSLAYYSLETSFIRLSDGNMRTTISFTAGYKFYKNLSLKLQNSYDNMRHEYSGDIFINGESFSPYEVYYSPRGVSARGLGFEYAADFKGMSLSLSSILAGKETRDNGPESRYNNITVNLSRPVDDMSGFSLNFYGSKSEVNPFSDQAVKSTYIGRELYLKYYYKL